MNNTVKSEKYRKLSITALVTGILAVSLVGFWSSVWFSFSIVDVLQISNVPLSVIWAASPMLIALGLSITAVVCGSIDLKRIRAGLYGRKGKGFDITGIVLGGVIILFALVFVLGDIIVESAL
jgi:hypothetical protein